MVGDRAVSRLEAEYIDMLVKFTIHSVKSKKSKYQYSSFNLGNLAFSKEKEAWEWTYEITSTDGERYFLFHEKKPDRTIRPYRNCYGNARLMKSDGSSKYSAEHEGAYRLEYTRHPMLVKALDTKEVFEKAARLEIERRKEQIASSQAEIARLESLLK